MRFLSRYDLERPYSDWWFIPLVCLGGSLLFVFVTWFNYVASGFNLVVIYTTDFNGTTNHTWQGHWSDVLVGAHKSATCQPALLAVGSSFYTTNNMLAYTVAAVESPNGTALPSLGYSNNYLEKCNVSSILLTSGLLDTTAAQISASWWSIALRGTVQCDVNIGGSHPSSINLTVDWNPWPATMTTYDVAKFPGRNKTTHPSLYWGESLLTSFASTTADRINYWLQNMTSMEATFTRGIVNDVQSLDYFNVSARFANVWYPVLAPNQTSVDVSDWYLPGANVTDLTFTVRMMFASEDAGILNVGWMAADSLAKAFEATIQADLGQSNWTTPNLLNDTKLLEYFSQNISMPTRARPKARRPSQDQLGLATQPYNPKNQTAPLGFKESTFAVNYLCNVLARKSTRELFQTILIADLVLLRAAWAIFSCIIWLIYTRRTKERLDRLEDGYRGDRYSSPDLESLKSPALSFRKPGVMSATEYERVPSHGK